MVSHLRTEDLSHLVRPTNQINHIPRTYQQYSSQILQSQWNMMPFNSCLVWLYFDHFLVTKCKRKRRENIFFRSLFVFYFLLFFYSFLLNREQNFQFLIQFMASKTLLWNTHTNLDLFDITSNDLAGMEVVPTLEGLWLWCFFYIGNHNINWAVAKNAEGDSGSS